MMRKLSALVILGLLTVGLALPASAHSFYGEGDCDGWTLHLDGTWNASDITVDGVSIGLEQNPHFADDSDATERTFVVVWVKQEPVTRTVTVERTLDCDEETTTTLPEDTTTTTSITSSTTTTQPDTSSTTSSSLPGTTTSTDSPTTTTSLPAETTTVPAPPPTDVCESEGTVPDHCLPPPELPFTGPAGMVGLLIAGVLTVGIGTVLVREFRSE